MGGIPELREVWPLSGTALFTALFLFLSGVFVTELEFGHRDSRRSRCALCHAGYWGHIRLSSCGKASKRFFAAFHSLQETVGISFPCVRGDGVWYLRVWTPPVPVLHRRFQNVHSHFYMTPIFFKSDCIFCFFLLFSSAHVQPALLCSPKNKDAMSPNLNSIRVPELSFST